MRSLFRIVEPVAFGKWRVRRTKKACLSSDLLPVELQKGSPRGLVNLGLAGEPKDPDFVSSLSLSVKLSILGSFFNNTFSFVIT